MSTDPSANTLVDSSGETPLPNTQLDVVEMHRAIAMRLLREGSPVQAFQELVRATRVVPMSPRLASSLTLLAIEARTFAPALSLLNEGLAEIEGDARVRVMRQLARLARRAGELERCREGLVQLLAEHPGDRRARGVLNGLLEQEERWEELDGSLEKETKEALRRGALRVASRVALRRARLWDTRLEDLSRAALRYMQAAQYAQQAGDLERAFWLRLLWVRALVASNAPARALEDAAKATLEAGEKVGHRARAQVVLDELGLGAGKSTETTTSVETGPMVEVVAPPHPSAPPRASAPPRRHSTQIELIAIADEAVKAGQRVEAAAVLSVVVHDGDDPKITRRLEALHVQRGAWRELADLYRQLMGRAAGADRAAWAEKLAELLESELHDAQGAAKAWAEVVTVTGDPRAVSEQVRLLGAAKDKTGIRAALEVGIKQAQPGPERARALVLRAEEALTRHESLVARADFEAALQESPFHPGATAGLAELAASQGDLGPVRALEAALARLPRHSRGRGDLYRRLARLADAPVDDVQLGRMAWAEVLVELPDDQEASARMLTLSRAASDETALEAQLKALLAREPRGVRARPARLELVALYERRGRTDEALAALKEAVRLEPGHQAAWLGYADRLEKLGTDDEQVAWALEHGATATEAPLERAAIWQRLATFAQLRLRDDARSAAWAQRASRLYAEHAPAPPAPAPRPSPLAPPVAADLTPTPVTAPPPPSPAPTRPRVPGLPGGPLVIPARRVIKPVSVRITEDELEKVALAIGARVEPERAPRLHARIPERILKQLDDLTLPPALAERPVPPLPPRNRPARPLESAPPEVEEIHSDELELPSGEFEVGPGLAAAPPARAPEPSAPTPLSPVGTTPRAPPAPTPPPPMPSPPPLVVKPAASPPVLERASTLELPAPQLGDPAQQLAPSYATSPSKALSVEREALFERVRANPLDADGYRILAEHFDTANDATRSSLMLEIARALEGDPHAAPRSPRLILSETDRAGLRHPILRGESGELLTLVGQALCLLHPSMGRDAGTDQAFHLEAGKGARASADSLLAAVRILGVRAPDVYLSDDAGPPFSLALTLNGPRVLVGRTAIKRELESAELRFFAGRALFTMQPDLAALRNVRKEQVLRGLALISEVARGKVETADARLVRDTVATRSWDRVRELLPQVSKKLDVSRLVDGARHSANRAGLVVCGGIAPAVNALRTKKALPAEMTELVRFAASERYLQLRGRVLGRR